MPQESAAPEDQPFNPRAHIRRLGRGEYLDVKWRLIWIKEEHPDVCYETERLEATEAFALFRATVWYTVADSGRLHGDPDGEQVLPPERRVVTATAHGSETRGDFGDYIEKAETKAIGRALLLLGYGANALPPDDRPVDTPAEHPQRAQQPQSADPELEELKSLRRKVGEAMKRTGASKDTMKAIAKKYGGVEDSAKLTVDGFTAVLDYLAKVPDGMLSDDKIAEAVIPEAS